jgi:hypothetical protein
LWLGRSAAGLRQSTSDENDGGAGVQLQKRRRIARPPRKNSPCQWTGYSSSLLGFRQRAAVCLVRLPFHFPCALL